MLCLKERVDNLRLWRNACWKFSFVDMVESTVISGGGHMLETFGPVYAMLQGNSVVVSQPASRMKGIPEKEWTVQLSFSGIAVETFAYDDVNQLLVVVQYE